MKKVYFLHTCTTCKRILKEVNSEDVQKQELKTQPITVEQLEAMYALSKSYEALFNKRAKLYRDLQLNTKHLSETDYKHYLLQEYTFLKRPVFVIDDQIFIGNSKKVIENLKHAL